jgi:hypothetical protein
MELLSIESQEEQDAIVNRIGTQIIPSPVHKPLNCVAN